VFEATTLQYAKMIKAGQNKHSMFFQAHIFWLPVC